MYARPPWTASQPTPLNADRLARDVIVIGGSAGSVQPLVTILGALPAGLPAAVAIVVHRSPFRPTQLPQVLGRHSALRVLEPADGTPVEPGVVFVAPRDQHLVLDGGLVRIDGGARQHRTRPAIDPLFVSAAATYGPRVVGLLLSGMGADGVSGFLAITAAGGITLVQAPDDAQFPTMPLRALRGDDVSGALRLEVIAPTLAALAAGGAVEAEVRGVG